MSLFGGWSSAMKKTWSDVRSGLQVPLYDVFLSYRPIVRKHRLQCISLLLGLILITHLLMETQFVRGVTIGHFIEFSRSSDCADVLTFSKKLSAAGRDHGDFPG